MSTGPQQYSLELSAFYEEYEALAESKDWVQATLTLDDGRVFLLNFTTLVRLAQDAEDDLQAVGGYVDENLVIVRDTRRSSIEAAASELVTSERLLLLRHR
jgi:hypothetical protein